MLNYRIVISVVCITTMLADNDWKMVDNHDIEGPPEFPTIGDNQKVQDP